MGQRRGVHVGIPVLGVRHCSNQALFTGSFLKPSVSDVHLEKNFSVQTGLVVGGVGSSNNATIRNST
jgi:hypothetical protein